MLAPIVTARRGLVAFVVLVMLLGVSCPPTAWPMRPRPATFEQRTG